jgi:type I restriction enzyme, S subunit
MKRVELGSVASVKSGFAFKSRDWKDGGIPVIKIANVKDGFVNLDGCSFVDESVARGASAFELKPGDILISMTGYIGEVARVRNEGRMLLNQRVGKFNIKNPAALDGDFLFYCLRDPELKAKFVAHAYGAAQPNISPTLIEQQDISLPPVPIQRRIAGILSAYDDLIENSQRRIKILESMARALYREWFVHFRFPGYESVPRVPSSLGEIPEGWEVAPLANLCSRIESGGTPKRSRADYWDSGDIDWYKTGELWDGFLFDSQEKITEIGQRESTARLFEAGTILMAIYGSPTVGRMGILTRWASCNQAALGLMADKSRISQIFLFFVLLGFRDHFNGIAQGAAQQNISKEKVASAMAIVPRRHLILEFEAISEPVFEQIHQLQRRVQNLRRTRDLLLPRLLSGQIALDELKAS